jgi:hypothetical protein|tara:strand:+ start:926 stop:1237 length:312 start_codon:yes stop_codon:yes gene_type:complete
MMKSSLNNIPYKYKISDKKDHMSMLKQQHSSINSIKELQTLSAMQQIKFSKSPNARMNGDFMQQTSAKRDYYNKKINAFDNYKTEIHQSIKELSSHVAKSPQY